MRKRRLVTIGHSYVVSLNRRLGHELSRTAPPRWEVTVVAPNSFHGDFGPIQLQVDHREPCNVESVPVRHSRNIHLMGYGRKTKSILSKNWDLVHCWEEPYIYSSTQISRWTGSIPLIFYTYQNIAKRYPPPFSWFEAGNIKRSAGWIAGGQTVRATLLPRSSYSDRPHTTITLGVDVQYFSPNRPLGKTILQKLGWNSDGPPVVGYLGRFVLGKGLRVLMQALDACRSPWRALFVGGGVMQHELESWSKKYPGRIAIANNVQHHDVPGYLNAMDLLVAPSQTQPQWREQLGRMLIEAFACGVPVIASDSGEIPHVVDRVGRIVPEHDIEQWSSAIDELLESPSKRQSMSNDGLERAHSTFAWPVIAKQHWSFFERVLDEKTPWNIVPISSVPHASNDTTTMDVRPYESKYLDASVTLRTTKQPRKLLSIGHSYVLGVNRRLAHEFQKQSDGKWEVSVIAPKYFKGRNDIRPNAFQRETDEPILVDAIRARWTGNMHFFHYEKKLTKIVRSGFDLVHAWEEPYIAAGFQIARTTPSDVPLVFRTAQSLNKVYPPPFRWMEHYCTERMSGWIYSGELVQQNLLRRDGYGDKPNFFAPLGFDDHLIFVNRDAGQSVRRQLGGDHSAPVIGYLGRFVVEKGLRVLMKALDNISTPWRALLVGNGPLLKELQSWATQHPGKVSLCTEVPHAEVGPYINAMDLLVAPSLTFPNWREQFGRMVVEAFACGVPVIGSDSGELPYVIRDTGVVVRENDSTALRNAIVQLVDDRAARDEFSQQGLQRAHSEYTWARVAKKTLTFFDEIVEKSK